MLLHFGVTPYLVFDGDYLPSKASTEVDRAKRREESKRKGLELYHSNKPSQAHLELQKAVDVTPTMAWELIEELKKLDVKYVVAPYEADAQLVYLEKKGLIQGMLSEDSDLLVFGARRLLTKLDQYGDCIEINRADFTACREVSLVGWTDAEFRRMAILSGCDYLPSINGMGLKKAYRMVRKYKTIDKILRMLQFDGKFHVPAGYLEAIEKAELTFLYQRVFCPSKDDIVTMTTAEDASQVEHLSFIGATVKKEVAIAVARGDIDPVTKCPIRLGSRPQGLPVIRAEQRVASTTESSTKENKSLENFFKPKRTPLAEISPNCFRPSPAQVDLLRQANGRSWEPSTVDPAALSQMPRVSQPAARKPPSRETSEDAALKSSMSHSAPKKRRFFDDASDDKSDISLGIGDVTQSPFFKTKPNFLSRTQLEPDKRARNGRSREATAFSHLSDVANLPEKRKASKNKGFAVFADETLEAASADSQVQTVSLKASQSSSTSKNEAMASPCLGTSTSGITDNAGNDSVLNTSQSSESTTNTSLYGESESVYKDEKAVKMSDSKFASNVTTPALAKMAPVNQKRTALTPLQRLGAVALNRSKSFNDLHARKGSVGGNSDKEKAKTTQDDGYQSFASLTSHSSFGPDASVSKGSEDLLIREEDEHDECTSNEPVHSNAFPDLGRFAFAG